MVGAGGNEASSEYRTRPVVRDSVVGQLVGGAVGCKGEVRVRGHAKDGTVGAGVMREVDDDRLASVDSRSRLEGEHRVAATCFRVLGSGVRNEGFRV